LQAQQKDADANKSTAQPFLAYEHSLTLGVDKSQVASLYETTLATCRAVSNAGCMVLDSHLNSGHYVTASLKLRVRPDAVKTITTALGKLGEITYQATRVEDLAAPIGDAEKKLAMHISYRTQLEGLRGKANDDIDAAIKITKELAQVQAQIESLSGERAYLMKRVQTEILNINIDAQNSFAAPIQSATHEFASNLAQGISSAITTIAFVLPWLLALLLLGWPIRWLWRKTRAKTKN
jgi:glycine cleavage system regulatory protein